MFVETEGGGTARRCRVPINAGLCVAGFGNAPDSHCVDLFTCNLYAFLLLLATPHLR